MKNNKTAIVTGITGCIGHNLTERLIEEGIDVIGLIRSSSDLSKIKNIKEKISLVDIDSHEIINLANREIDYCFHCAGSTYQGDNADNLRLQYISNVSFTKKIVEFCEAFDVKKFVHMSTAAVYYLERKLSTQKNNSTINFNGSEDHYIKTKYLSECCVRDSDLNNWTIIRPAVIFGKYDYNNYSKIFKLINTDTIKHSLPSGISICSIENVVSGIMACVENDCTGKTYLFSDKYISFQDIFQEISNSLGKKTKFRPVSMLMLKILVIYLRIKSYFTKEEPIQNKNIVNLLTLKRTDDIGVLLQQSKQDLGYPVSEFDLQKIISKKAEWLKNEKLI